MARETLFETQEVTGFQYMEDIGYAVQISPAPFTLTVGETYVIVLDGKEYTRTAFAFDAFASGVVAVGNDYPVTGVEDPDNLPVIVGYDPNENYVGFVALAAADELEIGVYKEVEEEVYYSVSSLSLKALGNAIRAKSGTGDALRFPDGMVEAVGNITGGSGGGSSDYPDAIHTVTFMNGGEELRVRAVVDGDNCADVADRGLIEQPAKESTAQYEYTYSGWSLTDGGSASSTALSNVTEDRTVYAAFTTAVRYYTVTYYDSDGATVLKTESLAYGTTPSYEPEDQIDFSFKNWIPSVTAVTGDTSYTAVWAEKTEKVIVPEQTVTTTSATSPVCANGLVKLSGEQIDGYLEENSTYEVTLYKSGDSPTTYTMQTCSQGRLKQTNGVNVQIYAALGNFTVCTKANTTQSELDIGTSSALFFLFTRRTKDSNDVYQPNDEVYLATWSAGTYIIKVVKTG